MARQLIPTNGSTMMFIAYLAFTASCALAQVPAANLNDIGRQTTLYESAAANVWGTKANTRVGSPEGICSDNSAYYYLMDVNRVTRISATDFSTTLIAGSGTAGSTADPIGTSANIQPIDCTAHNNALYLTVSYAEVMKVDLADPNFAVTTIAGSGTMGCSEDATGSLAQFQTGGITYRAVDNMLYIGTTSCRTIASIDLGNANHPVAWYLGSTQGDVDGHRTTTAQVDVPAHPVVSTDGNKMYFIDTIANQQATIKVLDFTTDVVTTLLKPQGLFAVTPLTVWGDSHLAFVEQFDGVVGVFDINSNTVSFPIGRPNVGAFMNVDGPAAVASMNGPQGIVPIISGVSQESAVFGEGLIYGQKFGAVVSVMTLPTASMTVSASKTAAISASRTVSVAAPTTSTTTTAAAATTTTSAAVVAAAASSSTSGGSSSSSNSPVTTTTSSAPTVTTTSTQATAAFSGSAGTSTITSTTTTTTTTASPDVLILDGSSSSGAAPSARIFSVVVTTILVILIICTTLTL